MAHNGTGAANGTGRIPEATAEEAGGGVSRSPSRRQAILIVDDRRENLVALRRVLASVDADTVEASSGNAALAATLDRRFALAIVDVQMPGMSGYELAAILRGDPNTRLIPIIFQTATWGDEQHMFQGYEAGGVDYIVKPFDPQVLLSKVRVFLELDRAREELRRHRDELEGLVSERTAEVRQRAEEVQQAARDWQTTFDAMHEAVALLGPDLTFRRCNAAMRGLLKKAGDETIGEPCCRLVHGADAPPPGCPAERALRSLRRETWTTAIGGRWFDVAADPILDEAGTVSGFIHVLTDITEQMRTEDVLRAAHEQLRQLVDSNIVGIAVAGADGSILEANDYYLGLTGYSREEFVRGEIDWRALTPPEWLPADERAIAELRERGRCTPYEKEYLRRDGSLVAIYVADVLLTGGTERIAEVVIDISARRRAERELALANRRLQELIEAVQALSEARRVEDVAAVVRSHARRLVEADGATFVLREGDQCFHIEEDGLQTGVRIPLADGACGWAVLHGEALVIPDVLLDERTSASVHLPAGVKSLAMVPIHSSEPIGAIGVYWGHSHEATGEEVRLIRTLADASANALDVIHALEELEARVAARTVQLTEANHELEAFSYSVSHDLRAPLRAIDGFSGLLAEQFGATLDPEALRLLGVVRASCKRMSTLIDDLLTLSRLGRTEMRTRRIDMVAMVRQVLDEVLAAEDRSRWIIDIAELPDAEGDPGLIRQVWANLLQNAVKFSRRGEHPKLSIGSSPGEEMVAYRVEDNGVGFDMAFASKLFGVFQRLHSVAEFPGTGVGLALVKRIVSRHGGTVTASGAIGQGASFSFTLPPGRKAG